MIRLIGMLMIGLKAWMLYDAYRRRAESYWFWIILGVPGGSLIYFFVIRASDRDGQRIKRDFLSFFARPKTLEQLQHAYNDSPSHENRVLLAQGLFDDGRLEEARTHFFAILEDRRDDTDALYGLGVCELDRGDVEAGIELMHALIAKKPAYRDYAAYPELARALQSSGKVDECLELIRGLHRSQPRLPHAVLLARYLRDNQQRDEAREVLATAMRHHDEGPKHVRRQYAAGARAARKMLGGLTPPARRR